MSGGAYARAVDSDEAAVVRSRSSPRTTSRSINGHGAVTSEPYQDDADSEEVDVDGGPPRGWTQAYARYQGAAALQAARDWFSSMWSGQKLAVSYLAADTRKHKRGLAIGAFTVFLVVLLVCVLQNNVSRSPVIFWRISETTVGENDLVLTNGFGVDGITTVQGDSTNTGGLTNLLVEQKLIDEKIRNLKPVQGSSGRWLLFGKILAGNTSALLTTSTTTTSKHTASAYLLGIDSVRESEISLGRSWDLPALDNSELYLTRSIVREIGMDPEKSVNAQVMLRLDMLDVAQTLNIAGIGGSASGVDDSINTTISHTRTEAERAAQEAREDDNTDLENQVLLLKILIQSASPNMAQMWDQNIDFGENTALVIAFVEYLNSTIATGADGRPAIDSWSPGDSIPTELLPLVVIMSLQYGMTVDQIMTTLQSILGTQVASADAAFATIDSSAIVLDQGTVSTHLAAIKNGTETYSAFLELMSPFILQLLRVDVVFTIKGVVDEPDGKWAEALGSVIVMESATLMNLLSGSIEKVLNLQMAVNMSTPIPIIPAGSGVPLMPSSGATYPLETLISFLGPAVNMTIVHSALANLDAVARSLQNNTRSLMSVVQYSGRLGVYLKTLDEMNADLMAFTNAVSAEGVGFDFPLTFTLPLAIAMKTTQYAKMFLDNVFDSVIALLVLIGMLLIYSLLLNDADSKTYEYGMLRALGMKHQTLMQILLSKSLVFSVIGISTGLFIAFLVNMPLAHIVATFAHVSVDYALMATPVILATVLGILMPLIANIVPISRALSKTLRDSLDVYHVVVSEVTVRVIKLSELGIDLWQSAISVLLIVVGFVTFYIVPYAFTFQDIPLFLAILNAILMGMLLGLCIIAQLLQPFLERLVLRVIVLIAWPHRKLYTIVVKNLSAHSGRNTKTANMFLICLAFLVFAGVMFNLQSRTLADNLKVYVGADLQIYSPLRDSSQHLKEADMSAYLDDMVAKRKAGDLTNVVEGYTFVSYPANYLLTVDRATFSSLPQFPAVRNIVWGVQENYLDVVYNEFFSTTEVNTGSISDSDAPRLSSGEIDAVRLMFQDRGHASLPEESSGLKVPHDLGAAQDGLTFGNTPNETSREATITTSYDTYLDVLVSEALQGYSSVTTSTPLHLYLRSWNENYVMHHNYLAKARALVVKLPGFVFSSYRQTASISSVIMGMDQFKSLMVDVYGRYPTPKLPPKQKLLIRCAASATRDQREDVVNGLRTFFRNDKTQAINTLSLIGTMDKALALLNLLFLLVGIIAMIMAFFMLWLSFTANVEENAWEFGVLRAIGLNSVEVVSIYIYESLALVVSSVILGTAIGLTVAATLTLQFNLFTELPFHMEFPLPLFLSMLFMSIGVAILGSGLPAYSFLNKTISSVLRRQ